MNELELLLGPFFAVTCLIEDSPIFKKYYFGGSEIQEDYSSAVLQQRLGVCRVRERGVA